MLEQNASAPTPVFVPPVFLSTCTTAKAPNGAAARPKKFPEPSHALKNQSSFSDILYGDTRKRAVAFIRSIRKARNGDRSAPILFRDVRRAFRDLVTAKKQLRNKEKELPQNRQLDYPTVRLSAGAETSFPSEIVRFYDRLIKDARDRGWIDILYLKERKIQQLKSLKELTEALIEDQRHSGLYDLRIEVEARRWAFDKLMFEACCTVRLDSRRDCNEAASFILFMARIDQASKLACACAINPYQLAAISRRLARRLASSHS
ncbi:hypothetical protein [Bradyrhizobium sp. CCBAU 21365]|uniref:hypothetical protein n=1 Tax=Bradyrhizobium sp. CCBAU 21365 TaxID=1325083 RepID=UPI00188DC11A|nr:hypothetical protein [Bradyrhizobium sp. CCBAU 21365]